MKSDFQHYVIYRLFRRAYPTVDALKDACQEYDLPQPGRDVPYFEALSIIIESGFKKYTERDFIGHFKQNHPAQHDAFASYLFNFQIEDVDSSYRDCLVIAMAPTLRYYFPAGTIKGWDRNVFCIHEDVPDGEDTTDHEYLLEVAQKLKQARAYFAILDSESGLNRPALDGSETKDDRRFWLVNDFASFYSLVSNLYVNFFVRGSGGDVLKDNYLEYYRDKDEVLTRVIKRRNQLVYKRGRYRTRFNPEPGDVLQTVEILHISDLHIDNGMNVDRIINPLLQDLKNRLHIGDLKYIVMTGDITKKGEEDEYGKALVFFDRLRESFQMPKDRLLLCPGNHDVHWPQGVQAYDEGKKRQYTPATLCDMRLEAYWKRFENYSNFTMEATGEQYPIDPEKQAIIHEFEDDKLLFLSLNSSWKIDKRYKERAGINSDALAGALHNIQQGSYENWTKIVFLHHPVCFPLASDKNFESHGWVDQLIGQGFTLMLTGHVHENTMLNVVPPKHQNLHLVGVGTIGSGASTRPESTPYQYSQLSLHLGTRMLRVRTRRKDSPEGCWWADARWGDNIDTSPLSEVSLQL